jgi:hypothetical protein
MPSGGRRLTTWVKGRGGPGRPKGGGAVLKASDRKAVADLKAVAQTFTQDALVVVHDIMIDRKVSPSVRLQAATTLLDRGWGKPAQTVMGPDGEPLPGTNVATVVYSGVLAEHDKTR